MNLVYFITGLGLGGAEVVTIDIANTMAKRGHHVLLCYLTGKNAHQDRISDKISVVGLEMNKTPYGFFVALRKTKKLFKQFNPDVVHGNMVHANIFLRILRICCPMKKLVCSEHSKDIRGGIRMLLYNLTDRLSDVNTNVSQEAVGYFIQKRVFSKDKSLTMYNGVDLQKFQKNNVVRAKIRNQYNISETNFLWINVGRLTEAKDHRNLLLAFSKVHQSKLMIIGQGNLQNELEQQIIKLGLTERVILAGAQSNVVDFYNASDCFVLSSAWEGLPLVILEAMSCELPIISTNVGGALETIGNSNWVIPTKNSNFLAQKMQEMFNLSENERHEMGKQNRQKSQRFDIEKICGQWEEIYQNKTNQ